MTRAEAIKRFEKQLTEAMVVLDSGFGTRPGESDLLYRKRKEMAEIALQALREQEERENPKPLTIEELDKMIGEPVYIFSKPLELWEWNVLAYKGAAYFGFKNGRKLSFGRYGEQWIAYRHKPKEEPHG